MAWRGGHRPAIQRNALLGRLWSHLVLVCGSDRCKPAQGGGLSSLHASDLQRMDLHLSGVVSRTVAAAFVFCPLPRPRRELAWSSCGWIQACVSACLRVCVSVCLPACLPTCLPTCLPVCLLVWSIRHPFALLRVQSGLPTLTDSFISMDLV